MGTNKTIRAMNNDILEKGKSMPIGTIHNGFKKVAEGKWRKVSEHGMTKEEHQDKVKYHSERLDSMRVGYNSPEGKKHQKDLKEHYEQSKKLDSKEYSDTEVVGKENKNKNFSKEFEIKRGSLKDSGYGFKIGEMDINGEIWRISFDENGSFDHATVFNNQDNRGREISLMNKKLRGLNINQDMFNGVKKDNIQKALTTLEIGYLNGEVDQDTIEKARAMALGTRVTHADGITREKTANGWRPVKKESGVKSALNQPEMSEESKDKVFGKEKEIGGMNSISMNSINSQLDGYQKKNEEKKRQLDFNQAKLREYGEKVKSIIPSFENIIQKEGYEVSQMFMNKTGASDDWAEGDYVRVAVHLKAISGKVKFIQDRGYTSSGSGKNQKQLDAKAESLENKVKEATGLTSVRVNPFSFETKGEEKSKTVLLDFWIK